MVKWVYFIVIVGFFFSELVSFRIYTYLTRTVYQNLIIMGMGKQKQHWGIVYSLLLISFSILEL